MTPRLKKNGLQFEELSSYHPIANLSNVTKLAERAAAGQMKEYLTAHNVLPWKGPVGIYSMSFC